MARDVSPPEVAAGPPRARAQELDQALVARLSLLTSDRALLARAHLERSLVDELLGDGAAAAAHAESALGAMDSPAAHATLRRLLHERGAERMLLAHQAAELAATVGDAARADRWAERGRLLRAAGEDRAQVITAFESALASAPGHPAALKGLEEELVTRERRGERREALAGHLARMADAYAEDAALAARLHVERAELLDATDVDAAREALKRALTLDPNTAAVREACVTHASRHREWAWLAELLDVEAAREDVGARAAALELEAACIQRRVLGRDDRAIALLERAAARAPTTRRVVARGADELVLLYERAGTGGGDEAEQVLRAAAAVGLRDGRPRTGRGAARDRGARGDARGHAVGDGGAARSARGRSVGWARDRDARSPARRGVAHGRADRSPRRRGLRSARRARHPRPRASYLRRASALAETAKDTGSCDRARARVPRREAGRPGGGRRARAPARARADGGAGRRGARGSPCTRMPPSTRATRRGAWRTWRRWRF